MKFISLSSVWLLVVNFFVPSAVVVGYFARNWGTMINSPIFIQKFLSEDVHAFSKYTEIIHIQLSCPEC